MGEIIMYLIDTNILIYYFNDNIPVEQNGKIENILNNSFNISLITKIEFLGFPRHTDNSFKRAEEFLSHAETYNLSSEIIDKTIKLRRNYKIKLPDAIIAATTLNNDFVLITRNEQDFNNIKNIEIFNPFSDK